MLKLLTLTSLALLTVALAQPAHADQVCSGTVRAVSPQTVWINTSQGVYAVPVQSANFQVWGGPVDYAALYPGLPITVYAPRFSRIVPQTAVNPQPVFYPVRYSQPRHVVVPAKRTPPGHAYGRNKAHGNKHR